MPPPWSEVEVSSPQGGELSGVTKVHLNRSYSKRTMCFDERLSVHCYLESRLQCKESPITDPEHWWCWIFNASCSLEENQSQPPIYCITILPPNSRRMVNIWKRGLRCLSINTNTNLSECLSTNTSNPWFSPGVTLSSASSSSSTFLWKNYKV